MDQSHQTQFFSTWPGLTEKLVSLNLPKSEATVRGKQTRVCQNIQSTQILHENIDDPDTCNDAYPAQTSKKENVVVLSIIDPQQLKHGKSGVVFSDIT
eukprot:6402392-Ditylum_brightwellii.AAC.1